MIRLRLISSIAAFSVLAAAQTVPDFTPSSTYPSGTPSSTVVVGDFNGDGLADIASTDSSILGFQICPGAPGGVFGSPVPRSVGFLVGPIVAVDVNNDGVTDLAYVASLSLAVTRSLPGGALSGPTFLAGGHSIPTHLAAGDFNKDGFQDLIVAGSQGFSYLRNLGDGSFALPVMFPQPVSGSFVLTGDFNNDGNLDFVGTAGPTSYSYPGNGNGAFGAPVSTASINYGASMADFNNDGKLDIVQMTSQPRQEGTNQAISISVGQGNGSFINQYNYVLNTPIGIPVAGDFTGDGKADVAIFVNSTASLRVFPGGGAFGVLLGTPYSIDPGLLTPGFLLAADVDGNGAKDLVLTSNASHRIYRNTHGNPPLLAQVKAAPASVIGGAAAVTGTVSLGGPAPATGAVVTLVSANPSLVSFPAGNTVTIAPGVASASFAISTAPVAAPASVTISASWNNITTTTQLDLVAPYSLSNLSVSPASQYGIFNVTGSLTLSSAADAAAAISLNSSNTALATVPATVTVPAGASSVNFAVALRPVTVDSPVSISASFGGVTRNASITVLRPLDSITISKAILTQRTSQLKVEATGSNAAATITVHVPATGVLLGTLSNRGGGKYDGTVIAAPTLTTVTLKSSLGGTVTGALQVK